MQYHGHPHDPRLGQPGFDYNNPGAHGYSTPLGRALKWGGVALLGYVAWTRLLKPKRRRNPRRKCRRRRRTCPR